MQTLSYAGSPETAFKVELKTWGLGLHSGGIETLKHFEHHPEVQELAPSLNVPPNVSTGSFMLLMSDNVKRSIEFRGPAIVTAKS